MLLIGKLMQLEFRDEVFNFQTKSTDKLVKDILKRLAAFNLLTRETFFRFQFETLKRA